VRRAGPSRASEWAILFLVALVGLVLLVFVGGAVLGSGLVQLCRDEANLYQTQVCVSTWMDRIVAALAGIGFVVVGAGLAVMVVRRVRRRRG
jgi:hypothetical protein